MKRAPILGMLFALACVSIVLPVASSAAPKIGAHNNGFSKAEERGLHVYIDCWAELKDQCGRNIVDDGLASGNPPSEAKVREWTATMDRWLNPPAPPAVDSPVVVAAAPAGTSVPSTSATTGGCPSYMAAEASSPSAVNPSSGAAGCYQIIPSTQAAYGCGAPDAACAAAICADVGATAWQASGADPCPYVQP